MLFSWIIANIFMTVYHIFDTKMCPYTTFLYTRFQDNKILTHFHFMVTLTPLGKEQKMKSKKNEQTKPIFGSSYLLAQIGWNLESGVLMVEGISTAKIIQSHAGSVKLHMCKNFIIVLPVNVLTGVARWLLGPHGTLPYVLMYWYRYHVWHH